MSLPQEFPRPWIDSLAAYRRIIDLLGSNYLNLGHELFNEFHRDYLRPLWGFERNWDERRLKERLQELLDLEAEVVEAVEEGRERRVEMEKLDVLLRGERRR